MKKKNTLQLRKRSSKFSSYNDVVSAMTEVEIAEGELIAGFYEENGEDHAVLGLGGVSGATKTFFADSMHKLDADFIDDTNTTNKFVTSAQIEAWNNKQDAPTKMGTQGQVLTLDAQGNPVWTTVSPSGTMDTEMSDLSTNPVQNKVIKEYVDSLGIFDISSYHATGGVLAKYADLTAALGTNGANIPEAIRKGGMSVKFVQSSDNKYVQYFFLLSDSFTVAQFANSSNWEKVNLEKEVNQLKVEKVEINSKTNLFNKDWLEGGTVIFANGSLLTNASYSYTPVYIPVEASTSYHLSGAASQDGTPYALSDANTAGICYYNQNLEYIDGIWANNMSFTTPSNCAYIRFGVKNTYLSARPYIMLNKGTSRASWEDYNPISGYIPIDTNPTQNSKNPVSSGGVYSKLTEKANITDIADVNSKMGLATICNLMQFNSTLGGMTYSIDNGVLTLSQNNTGNQAVVTNIRVNTGTKYKIRIVGKCSSGTQKLMVGIFESTLSERSAYIELTTTNTEFIVSLTGAWNGKLALGILSADVNVGNDITIDAYQYIPYDPSIDGAIEDLDERVNDVEEIVEQLDTTHQPITFNIDGSMQSLSRNKKYLTRIAFAGDSLTANAIGGNIPSSMNEGTGKQPIRMNYNNVPRRMYDFLSWNKPTWRRLDDADWTNSGFSEIPSGSINFFEGAKDKYFTASASGNYIEITVPSGKEHFALVARTKSGNGKLNVTINGNAPSTITYENPVLSGNTSFGKVQLENYLQNNTLVNTSICPINMPSGVDQIDLNIGISPTGNPYALFEFNNLPSGQANVIRFTTVDNNPVDVWGGFYWSGNTMVIMNIAHGGHTSSDLLSQHLQDELYNGGYDAVVFEFPEMNNTRLTIEQTKTDLNSIITSLKSIGIDFCFTSCNIMGLSIPADKNYWNYTGIVSNQLDINDAVKEILYGKKLPFVDLFQYFRYMTENKGGTLTGGEAGLWFTNDGQHGNILGVSLWADCLKQLFYGKAIMES